MARSTHQVWDLASSVWDHRAAMWDFAPSPKKKTR
jgi:hypothetical protein